MKKLFLSFAAIALIVSCSNNEDGLKNEPDFGGAAAKGLSEGLRNSKMGFDKDVILKYTDENDKEQIMTQIINDLYEIELKSSEDKTGRFTMEIAEVDIVHNDLDQTIIIRPLLRGYEVFTSQNKTDDELCGGKDGDGWKNFGTATSESGTEGLSKKAAAEFKNQLSSGNCLDIRIKRNTFNARVCARVVKC